MSSAKVLRIVFSDCGLSAVYTVYNSGPSMLPWGTPESIRNGDEVSLLHVVTKYLFCRYDVRGLKYSGGGRFVLQVKNFCLVIGVMEEQRVAIKFCVKAGKSAVESIELINKAYGSAAMSRADVYRRYAGFREGREEVKDDARTDENVESVRRLLTEDRRTTLQVIADRLNIGKETVRRVVTGDLGKKKDLREIRSSRLDHRAETRTRCLLPGSPFSGTR